MPKEIRITEVVIKKVSQSIFIMGQRGSGKTKLARQIISDLGIKEVFIVSSCPWEWESVTGRQHIYKDRDTVLEDFAKELRKRIKMPKLSNFHPIVVVLDTICWTPNTKRALEQIICDRHSSNIILINILSSDTFLSKEKKNRLFSPIFPHIIMTEIDKCIITSESNHECLRQMIWDNYVNFSSHEGCENSFEEFLEIYRYCERERYDIYLATYHEERDDNSIMKKIGYIGYISYISYTEQ